MAAWATVVLVAAIPWVALPAEAETPGAADSAVMRIPLDDRGIPHPHSPNPFLAFLPAEVTPDFEYWTEALAPDGRSESSVPQPGQFVASTESEPNDATASADVISGFGTSSGSDPIAEISGRIGPVPVAATFTEPNDAIGEAVDTGLAPGQAFRYTSTIGDGPYGAAGTGTGDMDFFAVDLTAGETLNVDTTSVLPGSGIIDLDPFVALYGATGTLLAVNDDKSSSDYDSYLHVAAPADGTYYVALMGRSQSAMVLGDILPADPTVPGTGPGDDNQGTYALTITRGPDDLDLFAVDLAPGDVVSVEGRTGLDVQVLDPSGTTVTGGSVNYSSLHPLGSPLRSSAAVSTSHVADEAGTHHVLLAGWTGPYDVRVSTFRPGLQHQSHPAQQTLFVDFDGAVVAPSTFDANAPQGTRMLSPLADFLGGWSLTAEHEDAVIDAILAVVEENLSADLRDAGVNGDRDVSGTPGELDLKILNSRDHVDAFGAANVSRVVVGGTMAQLGISTIGIASAIDPGNFSTADDAVVLLDYLSAPATNPNSLNQFASPAATVEEKIALVAEGVGNIVAHEAGHFLGSWHTERSNPLANVMDQGGDLANSVGVGPDGVFGTADDHDVDFVQDAFAAAEGQTGLEDTATRTAFALSTGTARIADAPSGLTATTTGTAADLAWTAPTTDGGAPVIDHRVRTFVAGVEVASALTGSGATTFTVTGLTPGVSHTFSVAAINALGEGPQSAPSNTVVPTTGGTGPPPSPPPPTPPPPPAIPEGIEVRPTEDGLLVSWTHGGFAQAGDPGFRVRAYEAGDQVVDEVVVAASPALLDDVASGATYRVGVVAFRDGVASQEALVDQVEFARPAPIGVTEVGAGDSARAEALEVCRDLVPRFTSASGVVLARDDAFADALAGAPLAGEETCVLFTAGGPDAVLDPEVRSEIDRVLDVGDPVTVLGGDQAVSAAVLDELQDAGYDVRRIAGATRYETAALIAAEVVDRTSSDRALLAHGGDFPDALVGGAYGAFAGIPILLTDTAQLHPATAAALKELAIDEVTVLGGSAVVGDEVLTALPDGQRIAGGTRMGTAAAVAERLWGAGADDDTIVLVNLEHEDAWILALAAAPLSAALGAPQLGLQADGVPPETANHLDGLDRADRRLIVVGSERFVAPSVLEELARSTR